MSPILLATWLSPVLAAVVASVGVPVGMRLSSIRRTRTLALERIASYIAERTTQGYDWQYPYMLEFYAGRTKEDFTELWKRMHKEHKQEDDK